HSKFGALKNILPVIDVVVQEQSERKLKRLVEALTPDIPLSKNRITEAKMFADAIRVILQSHDFVKAQDIAHVAQFSQKNPSSQPNRWKRQGKFLPFRTRVLISTLPTRWTGSRGRSLCP